MKVKKYIFHKEFTIIHPQINTIKQVKNFQNLEMNKYIKII